MNTRAPFSAKRLAAPKSMRALPPVTTAILFSSFLFINPFICDFSMISLFCGAQRKSVIRLQVGWRWRLRASRSARYHRCGSCRKVLSRVFVVFVHLALLVLTAPRVASLVRVLPLITNVHSSNTTAGSNFASSDRHDSCRGRLLPRSHAQHPCRLLSLFWVASMVYHWFPGLHALRAPQMPMLVSAAAVGGAFLVVGIPFAGLLATWFSSAHMASLERQTKKLRRNRIRIRKRHRDRDGYEAN